MKRNWNKIDDSNFDITGGKIVVTISEDQEPDAFHQGAYDAGGYILELDKNELQVAVYHKEDK